MKKKLTTSLSAFIVLFSASHAQIQKGEKTLGGIVGFNSRSSAFTNGYSTRYSWINLTPKLGFPLGNSWVAGPLLGYRYYREEIAGPATILTRSHTFQVGGFVRKSYGLSEKFGIYVEGEVGYGLGKTVYSNSINGINALSSLYFRQLSMLVKPGLYFKAGERFVIEASIGQLGLFQTTTRDANGYSSTSRIFDASIKNNLAFGIQFILR